MAKFRSQKNSLIAGEISPTAFGRTDLQQYSHACKTLKNMIPLLSGGAYRRPGTLFEQSYSGTTDFAPGLIPFVVSKTEGYMLVVGRTFAGTSYIDAYVPYRNTGDSASATVTGAPPYVGRIASEASQWGYYDEWHEVQYVQSADTMWMVHPRYKPYKVIRTAVNTLKVAAFDTDTTGTALTGQSLGDAYPYRAQNSTSQTMAISATGVGSGRTLTSSTAFFQTGHIGAIFKSNVTGTVGYCKVTAVALGGLTATVDVIVAFGGTGAVTTWWESAWSDYRGWPRSVGFFQSRLIFAGNLFFPDTLWFSKINTYGQMSTITDTDPTVPAATTSGFSFVLSSEQLNLIQWISADRTLVIGTQGDEWVMEPIDEALGVYGGNMKVSRQSHYGSSFNAAVRKDDEVIFCGFGQDDLRGLVFNDLQKAYVAEPVQILYEAFPVAEPPGTALGNRKIRAMAWDGSRKTLWVVDTAGNLRGLTRDRTSGVTCWHSHELGGFDETLVGVAGGIDTGGGAFTDDPAYIVCAGSVISVAVIPNPLIGVNDVWLVVKRKINGAFVYHVERIVGRNYPFNTAYQLTNPDCSYFVDAAIYVHNITSFPTIANDTFTGLTHLEAETPVGTAFNTKGIFKITGGVVASGSSVMNSTSAFHLLTENTTLVMGLPYDSVVEPVRIEAGSQIGTSQGGVKRLHRVTPRFYRTIGCKLGRDADSLETLIFREASTLLGKSAELFTGDKRTDFNGDYDLDGLIYILQEDPLPFAVVSVVAEGLEYDG